jgi:hypothetical protein
MTTAHDIDLQQVLTERLTAAHPMCCGNCCRRSSTP